MKPYIIGIVILFSIGTYFFITNKENSRSQQTSIEHTKSNKFIISKEKIDKEQKVNYNQNDKVSIIKKEEKPIETSIEVTQNSQLVEEKPLNILENIFSLKKGDKNNIPLQKEIASLESNLVSQLQSALELEEDTYNMFKKILNLEDSSIEDKQYVLDLLKAINTNESKALLIEIYTNSDDIELKDRITKLDTPEAYTLLALEANQNEDIDSYKLMINKLKNTDGNEVVSGFMAFVKLDDFNSLDNIKQLATEWSNNNLSQQNINLTEDYLSRTDTKPNERIIAISILSNMEDKEQRDGILRKRLEDENNQDVLNYLQSILYNES